MNHPKTPELVALHKEIKYRERNIVEAVLSHCTDSALGDAKEILKLEVEILKSELKLANDRLTRFIEQENTSR